MQASRFLQPRHTIPLAETLNNRFFDDGLTGGNAGQLGIEASSLHRKGILLSDPFLPRQSAHPLEKLLKGESPKAAKLDQNTLSVPAPQVRAGQQLISARKEDAPVLRLHVLRFHGAQLIRHKSLDPQKAGDRHLILIHVTAPCAAFAAKYFQARIVSSGVISRSRRIRPITRA